MFRTIFATLTVFTTQAVRLNSMPATGTDTSMMTTTGGEMAPYHPDGTMPHPTGPQHGPEHPAPPCDGTINPAHELERMYHEMPDMVRSLFEAQLAAEGIDMQHALAYIYDNQDAVFGFIEQIKNAENIEDVKNFAMSLPEPSRTMMKDFYEGLGETDADRDAQLRALFEEHQACVVDFATQMGLHLEHLNAEHFANMGEPSVQVIYDKVMAAFAERHIEGEAIAHMFEHDGEAVHKMVEEELKEEGVSNAEAAHWLDQNLGNLLVVVKDKHGGEVADHVMTVFSKFITKHYPHENTCSGPPFDVVKEHLNDYIFNQRGFTNMQDFVRATIEDPSVFFADLEAAFVEHDICPEAGLAYTVCQWESGALKDFLEVTEDQVAAIEAFYHAQYHTEAPPAPATTTPAAPATATGTAI